MNIARRTPRMTREEFFRWAEAHDTRYEFDGFQPVAMTGGLVRHSRVCQNLWAGLRSRLAGGRWSSLGPDAGLATVGDAVRYPDALVTCSKVSDDARTVPGVVVVFEVLSPTSGRNDRIDKVRAYRAVPSILRCIILEYASEGLTSFERASGDQAWTATTLVGGETLCLPEIGIELPVAECYEGIDLPQPGDPAEAAQPMKG